MKTNKLKKLKLSLKWMRANLVMTIMTFALSLPVYATDVAGGNPITDSGLFKGAMRLLNDVGIALMIIAPIVCGILIGIFALLRNAAQDDQDKLKYKKWMTTSGVTLIWVFASSSICTILGAYFKG